MTFLENAKGLLLEDLSSIPALMWEGREEGRKEGRKRRERKEREDKQNALVIPTMGAQR